MFQGEMLTPEQVWKDYDPSLEPLEVEVLKQWTKDGNIFKEMYFTGKTIGEEKVRIYGVYSAPMGGKQLPGILHVHGGGQTVNKDILHYWNERGYAALSFNWGGRRTDGQAYTDWGSALAHANHLDAGERMMATVPNVRASSWYEWAVAARRALTLLSEQAEVDPGKLGAFGVSMGGTLLWTLAATDKRIRASCAIYGLGWHTYKEEFCLATGDKPEYSEEAARIWREGMEPEAYAPHIHSPLLYINATNDFYGIMDRSFNILSALPEQTPRRAAFTPGFSHYIHWEQGDNIHRWMNTWLKGEAQWPQTPEVFIRIDEQGRSELAISPDSAQTVTRVEAYYAFGNPHAATRHWRPLGTFTGGDSRSVLLDVKDYRGTVYVYANVYYESGICLSSNLATEMLGDVENADFAVPDRERRTNVIYDGRDGLGGWVTNSPNADPFPHRYSPIKAVASEDGVRGFRPDEQLSPITYSLGDPEYKGREGEALSFQIFSRNAANFKIIVHRRYYMSHSRNYICPASLEEPGGWQTFTLIPESFKHEESGEALSGWEDVNYLELCKPEEGWPDENILFTNFKWISV